MSRKLYALDGEVFDAVLVGADDNPCIRDDDACCGCGESSGTSHDPGCDWEPCPRCSGQLISCNCTDDEIPGYSAAEALQIVANLSAALKGASHA